jgi:hypothetical protein
VGALVQQVGEVLGRGHALFGEPPASGGTAATTSGAGLAAAGDVVRNGQARISALSGAFPAGYTRFATDATAALDAASDADGNLSTNLRDSAQTDRSGRTNSGSVVNGAASDTAALAPSTRTAAGQRALVSALRERLAQQQQVISTYTTRDARLAAMVRSLGYSRQAGGGGMPMGGMPFGGGSGSGSGGSPLSGLSALSSLAGLGRGGSRDPSTMLAGGFRGAGDVPGEPGQGAARAALSKLGRPYVWAWGQAGVRLGGDTYAQIKEGIPVPPGQVRAGDLIFPMSSFGRGGPGHVQMAISDTQVVHAPTSGDVVRITGMPGQYIARRPVRLAEA